MPKPVIWHNVNSSCCKQCFASNSCRPKQYISNDVHGLSIIINYNIFAAISHSTILLLTTNNAKTQMLQNKTTHFKVIFQNTLGRDAAQIKTRTTSIIMQHRSANIELKALSILFSALTVSYNMQKICNVTKACKKFHQDVQCVRHELQARVSFSTWNTCVITLRPEHYCLTHSSDISV